MKNISIDKIYLFGFLLVKKLVSCYTHLNHLKVLKKILL